MKAPPEILPPRAIIAERDWLIGRSYFESEPERQPLFDRLCKDKAWHQLAKHRLAIVQPQLSKKWSEEHRGEGPDEKWTDKELALQMTFHAAFFLAFSKLRTRTAAEQRETADFYREKIKQYQEDALLLAEISDEAAGHARALAEFLVYLGLDSVDDSYGLLVGRHQKSPHVRAYCVLLARHIRRLYGHTLREIVASIANAAFDQKDVTKEDVGYWCK